MTDRIEDFTSQDPPRISLRLPAGEARFVPGEAGRVEIRMSGRPATIDRFRVEQRGNEIIIEPEPGSRVGRWSGIDVEIKIAAAAEIKARLAAGDVVVAVPVASLIVEAGAGDIRVGPVDGAVKLKTASGDIRIAEVGGRLDLAAASGDLRVGVARSEVNAKTAAGDIAIEDARADVTAHSASGDIEVGRFGGNSFNAKTLSGDVRLGVTSGRTFAVSFQSLSGDVRTDFPISTGEQAESGARLTVKTMSGDIVVHPADESS